jgi:hypothetical protein
MNIYIKEGHLLKYWRVSLMKLWNIARILLEKLIYLFLWRHLKLWICGSSKSSTWCEWMQGWLFKQQRVQGFYHVFYDPKREKCFLHKVFSSAHFFILMDSYTRLIP